MLIGQLFYYQKVIDTFPEIKNQADILKIELYSVDILKYQSAIEKMDSTEAILWLKDLFIKNYSASLKEEGLFLANQIWNRITSPYYVTTDLTANSEYTEIVKEWISLGSDLSEIKNLLTLGMLQSEESDYAVFYGLKVLDYFTNRVFYENKKLAIEPLPDLNPLHTFSQKSQILVHCNQHLNPLFKNLNILTLNKLSDVNSECLEILNILDQNQDIQLVILATDKSDKLEKIL